MKKLTLFSTLVIILLFACKNMPSNSITKEEIQNPKDYFVEADLFFSQFRIGSFYNVRDAKDMDINAVLDTLTANNKDSDSALIVLYKKLNERDLIFSPYIDVKLEDGTNVTWYLNQFDYDTIKTFKLKELEATKSKVHLTAEIEHIYQNAYLCKSLNQIQVIEALNYSNSGQFTAGDYR